MGGSAILDLGIYTLQLAQYIFKDEPIKVTAVGELNDDGVDLVDTVILEYAGGRRAVLNAHSKLKLWNKATVVGPLGRVTVCTFIILFYEFIHRVFYLSTSFRPPVYEMECIKSLFKLTDLHTT